MLIRLRTVDLNAITEDLSSEKTIRRDTQAMLRASEERILRIVDIMPIIIYGLGEDGLTLAWNQEGTRATGYTAEEIVDNPNAVELLIKDLDIRAEMREVLAKTGGEFRDREIPISHKDGSERIISWSSIAGQLPIQDWTNWGIGINVTELKKTSEALQQSEARYRTLFEAERRAHEQADSLQRLAIILNASRSADLIQDTILEQLAFVIDYDSASVQLLDGHLLTITAVAGLDQPEQAIGARFDTRITQISQPAISRGESLLIDGVHELPRWRGVSPEMDAVRSWMCVPLQGRQEILGMITVDSHEISRYDQSDVDLVRAFANHAALALENVQLYDQVQQFATDLEVRVNKRTAELEERFLEVDRLNQGMLNLMEDLQAAHFVTTATASELEQANMDLASANNELETFAYSVSHDLKAPLRAIDGYSQILQGTEEAQLSERGQYYLNMIRQATLRMTDLIQDLLAYARLERRELAIRKIELDPFIGSLVQDFERQIQKGQLTFKLTSAV